MTNGSRGAAHTHTHSKTMKVKIDDLNFSPSTINSANGRTFCISVFTLSSSIFFFGFRCSVQTTEAQYPVLYGVSMCICINHILAISLSLCICVYLFFTFCNGGYLISAWTTNEIQFSNESNSGNDKNRQYLDADTLYSLPPFLWARNSIISLFCCCLFYDVIALHIWCDSILCRNMSFPTAFTSEMSEKVWWNVRAAFHFFFRIYINIRNKLCKITIESESQKSAKKREQQITEMSV